MPQRLLRPTIRQSKRWNRASYFEQSLFIRLLTLVDDFGRYEADPELIRSEAFPYGDPDGNVVQVPAIDSAMLSFVSKDMIQLYEVNGSKFFQLNRWKERVRAEESKYPGPECGHLLSFDSTCQQMLASPPQPQPQPSPQPTPTPASVRVKLEKVDGELDQVFIRDLLSTYRRPVTAKLTYAEESTLAAIIRERPRYRDEWDTIITLKQKEPRYFPQSLSKLLTGWQETLDRASVWVPDVKTPKTIEHTMLEECKRAAERLTQEMESP